MRKQPQTTRRRTLSQTRNACRLRRFEVRRWRLTTDYLPRTEIKTTFSPELTRFSNRLIVPRRLCNPTCTQFVCCRTRCARLGMTFPEVPEAGMFMAVVIRSSANVRAARATNSRTIAEAKRGAYLGVISTRDGIDVLLPDGRNGVIERGRRASSEYGLCRAIEISEFTAC